MILIIVQCIWKKSNHAHSYGLHQWEENWYNRQLSSSKVALCNLSQLQHVCSSESEFSTFPSFQKQAIGLREMGGDSPGHRVRRSRRAFSCAKAAPKSRLSAGCRRLDERNGEIAPCARSSHPDAIHAALLWPRARADGADADRFTRHPLRWLPALLGAALRLD